MKVKRGLLMLRPDPGVGVGVLGVFIVIPSCFSLIGLGGPHHGLRLGQSTTTTPPRTLTGQTIPDE